MKIKFSRVMASVPINRISVPIDRISVVIPAYNEEKRLEKTLVKVIRFCKRKFKNYEIIVVNDCSKDKTASIAFGYKKEGVRLISNKANKGKGYSVKNGIMHAKYPLVLFSDSDLATPIDELTKFLDYIKQGFDVVIASRRMKQSNVKTKQPFFRQLLGKTFPLLVNIIALPDFKDTQCGFKLFKTSLAKKIVKLQTFERFSFDVELLFIAKKMGAKIKEAPVTWIDQEGSKVHPIKDSYRMLRDLVMLRINNINGKYYV
ncbi:glycosyltransferase family 2 protein [Candidatus Woesearchaeota archaeon]|nr:glycosyltransferase family 2 protein [Candidatus Woesearchaeota archaeon]